MTSDDYKRIHKLLEDELEQAERDGEKARRKFDFELAKVHEAKCSYLDEALAGVAQSWAAMAAAGVIGSRRKRGEPVGGMTII